MKLAVMVLLNALLAGGFGWWLRAQYRQASPAGRRWLGAALAWRLALTAISTHSPSPDILPHDASPGIPSPDKWGKLLSAYWLAHPASLPGMLQASQFTVQGESVAFYPWSGTLLVYKVFALLDLASGGVLWLNGLYLSLGCFMACWLLVRTLAQVLPGVPLAASGTAFLLWPSVVWWTSGLTKETLVLGSSAALVALLLRALYGGGPGQGWRRVGWWLALAALAWLHLRMRYFFALPLLGCLLGLALAVAANRRGWLRAGRRGRLLVLLGGAALLAAVVAVGGEAGPQQFVVEQLWANYEHGQRTSAGRPHLTYPGLQPTRGSIAGYFPLAAVYAVVRPWLGESAQASYVGAGLENLLLLALLAGAAWQLARGRRGQLPPALMLALLLYCLLLAGLIGLSTPNLGTLHRYRTVFLPWLLLVALDAAGLFAAPGRTFAALWKTRLLSLVRRPWAQRR